MVDQGLPTPLLVALAVLFYVLGITSLVLLRSRAKPRAPRRRAAIPPPDALSEADGVDP